MMGSLGDGWMGCEEEKKMEIDWGGSLLRVRSDSTR